MADLEQIKASTDIVKLIESSGIELWGNGHTLSGLCPFHEDKAPSLKVQFHKQWWYCYACSEGGDCFSWVMKRDNCSFSEAIEKLKEGNISVPIFRKFVNPPKPSFIPNSVVLDFKNELHSRPPLIDWLVEHRCWSRSIIDSYDIGYEPRTQRVTIPIKSPLQKEWSDIRLYDVWRKLPSGKKMMPYSSGREALPFFLTYDNDYLLFVEGEPDALAAASCGLNVATNTCGSGSVEKVWKEWFGLVFADKLYACFDLDEAGREAVYGIWTGGTMKKNGLAQIFKNLTILQLPEELGEKGDVTDAIKKYGHQWFKDFVLQGENN